MTSFFPAVLHNNPKMSKVTFFSLKNVKNRLKSACSFRCHSLNSEWVITFLMAHQHIIGYSHTHARLTALCPGLPRWAGTRKVKPIWILLKQETVSGNGISWAICKSAPPSRQITMPAPHHSVFTGRMPFLPPNQQHQSTEGNYRLFTAMKTWMTIAIKPKRSYELIPKYWGLYFCWELFISF